MNKIHKNSEELALTG